MAYAVLTTFCAIAVAAREFRVHSSSELALAADKARAGDEIVLEAGIYRDLKVRLACVGTKERPVIVRAAAPESVVIVGNTCIELAGWHIELRDMPFRDCGSADADKGAIEFDGAIGCRLTRCSFERSRYGTQAVVGLRNAARDNRIDHCRFIDTQFRAVRVIVNDDALRNGPPKRNRIDHNLFQGVPPMGKNGGETIQVGQMAHPYCDLRPETIIENNVFERCDGDLEIISLKTSGNTVRKNIFRNCQGEVVCRHGNDNHIEGNRFEGCLGGIRLSGSGHQVRDNVISNSREAGIRLYFGTDDLTHPAAYLPVQNCLITNNTVIDCGRVGIHIGANRNLHVENPRWSREPWFASSVLDCTVAPHGNRIKANIITGLGGILIAFDHAPENQIEGNCLFAQKEAKLGFSGESSRVEDPRFVSSIDGDFRLSDDSPLRAAGIGAFGAIPAAGPDFEK